MNQPFLTPFAEPDAQHKIEELETEVQHQLHGRVRSLRLLMVDDGVVLRGSAWTYHAKQLAQHAVMHGTALPIVANEIEVA